MTAAENRQDEYQVEKSQQELFNRVFCKRCNRRFIGRISFKKKFDEVIVKRIVEKREKSKKMTISQSPSV